MTKKTGLFHRAAALLLALVMMLSVPFTAAAAAPSDVAAPGERGEKWYSEAIYALYGSGIVLGTPQGTFEPNWLVTRGQFVTFLGRLAEMQGKIAQVGEIDGAPSFLDLTTSGHVMYQGYLGWAAGTGILLGDGVSYKENDTMTRQEMAAFLLRFSDYMGLALTMPEDPERDYNHFEDLSDISSWAKNIMKNAFDKGLLNGRVEFIFQPPEGVIVDNYRRWYLDPQRSVTRAEAVQMIFNYIGSAGISLTSSGESFSEEDCPDENGCYSAQLACTPWCEGEDCVPVC